MSEPTFTQIDDGRYIAKVDGRHVLTFRRRGASHFDVIDRHGRTLTALFKFEGPCWDLVAWPLQCGQLERDVAEAFALRLNTGSITP